MNKFLAIEKCLNGQFYICLFDDEGPVGRIEDWNYDTYDEAAREAIKIGKVEYIKFVGSKKYV